MKNLEVKNVIALEILNKMIVSLESKLNSKSLAREIRYNKDELNNSLRTDFNQISEVLQGVVDKFYLGYYEVNSFIPLHLEDLNFCQKHNLSLVCSMKKLLKFIN